MLVVVAAVGFGCAPARTGPAAGSGESLPAVQSLVESARTATAEGRNDDAAAYLERALRLQPDDPALWMELARTRRAQGQWDQAVSLALRSNSLASGDEDLLKSNWTFIAECRRAQGDEEGALDAEAKAASID
jgi:tetratricopeptide (TPR) repeat protein